MVVCCCGEGGRDADDESWLLLFRGMKERERRAKTGNEQERVGGQSTTRRTRSESAMRSQRAGWSAGAVESGDGGGR